MFLVFTHCMQKSAKFTLTYNSVHNGMDVNFTSIPKKFTFSEFGAFGAGALIASGPRPIE